MTKQKKHLYEEPEFDNVQSAIDAAQEYQTKLTKVRKGLHLSIIATIYNFLFAPVILIILLSFYKDFRYIPYILGLGLSITAYILGGGLKTAISWAFKFGEFLSLPLSYPFDLITLCFGFIISVIAFLFIPIILVHMNYKQINMHYQSALKYSKLLQRNITN